MRRYLIGSLLVALVMFPLLGYIYARGWRDGIAHYKGSRHFMLTLYSVYLKGVQDGCGLCGGKR